MRRNSWLAGLLGSLTRNPTSRAGRRLKRGHPTAATERLENRTLLTTDLTFAANTLTINIGAANETTTLVVAGTNLSVQTTDAGGVTVSGGAFFGFTAQAANANSTGSIAAANDVWLINIVGAGGIQSVVLQGGTFTAMSITDGLIENVTFDTADSSFDKIAAAAPNSNLAINVATMVTIGRNITTLDSQAASVGGNITISAPDLVINGAAITLSSGNNNTETTAGTINLSGVTNLSSAAAGNDITLDSRGVTTGGNIEVGRFNNSQGNFLEDVAISTAGNAADGSLTLHQNISLDGRAADAASFDFDGGGSGNVIVSNTLTLDTEDGNTNGVTGGLVDFTNVANISADAIGFTLTINTSNSDAGETAGAVTLTAVNNTGGGQYLDSLVVTADAATDGVVTLNGDLLVDGGPVTLDGNIQLPASRTIDTEQGNNGNAGAVNLAVTSGSVSATLAGVDLTINTQAVATFTGGNVSLGLFNNAGGQFVNSLDVDTTGAGTSGQIALNANIQTVDDVRFNGPVILNTDVRLDTDSTDDNTTGGNVLFTNDATIDSQATEFNDLVIDAGTASVFFNEDIGTAANGELGRLVIEEADGGVIFGQADTEAATDTGPVNFVELVGDGTASIALDVGSLDVIGGTGIRLNGGTGVLLLTITTSNDAVRFNGAVRLDTDLRIDTDVAAASGTEVGDVLFTNDASIDSQANAGNTATEGNDLTIDAGTASVFFNEDIGAAVNGELGRLVVEEADGGVTFGQTDTEVAPDTGPVNFVELVGDGTTSNALDLGSTEFIGTDDVLVANRRGIELNGGLQITITTTDDNVRFNGRVRMMSDVSIRTRDLATGNLARATVGNIVFEMSIDSGSGRDADLTLDAADQDADDNTTALNRSFENRFKGNVGNQELSSTSDGFGFGNGPAITILNGDAQFGTDATAASAISVELRGSILINHTIINGSAVVQPLTLAGIDLPGAGVDAGNRDSRVTFVEDVQEAPVISILSDRVRVRNLTIQGGEDRPGVAGNAGDGITIGAIADPASDTVISDNSIRDNEGDGIRIINGASLRNQITRNSTYDNVGLGIDLVGGTDAGPELSNGVTINDKERTAIATTLVAAAGLADTSFTLPAASIQVFLKTPLPVTATVEAESVLVVGVDPANNRVNVVRTAPAVHGAGSAFNVAAVVTSDADAGANNLQNTPEILYAYFIGTNALEIVYHVPSTNNAAISDYDLNVEFFLADFFDRNSDGALTDGNDDLRTGTDETDGREGATFIASNVYEESDALAPKVARLTLPSNITNLLTAGGASNVFLTFAKSLRIVATATDQQGNTSEFSRTAVVNPRPGLKSDITANRVAPTDPSVGVLANNDVPNRFFFDELTLTGFVFSAGSDSDLAAERPQFVTTWDTRGDQRPTDTVLPTFFDNEFGIYALASDVLAGGTQPVLGTGAGTYSSLALANANVQEIRSYDFPDIQGHGRQDISSVNLAALATSAGVGANARVGFYLIRNSTRENFIANDINVNPSTGLSIGPVPVGQLMRPNKGNAPAITDLSGTILDNSKLNLLNDSRAYAFFSVASANPDRNTSSLITGKPGVTSTQLIRNGISVAGGLVEPQFRNQNAKYHMRTQLDELTGELTVYWEDSYAPRNTGFGSSDFDQGVRDGEDAIIHFVDPFLRPVQGASKKIILNLDAETDLTLGVDGPGVEAGTLQLTVTGGGLTATVNGANQTLAELSAIRARDVSQLIIVGGAGQNVVNLSGVTLASFVNLASVSVDGSGGNDSLVGSEFGDSLIGGTGNDTLMGQGGNDTLAGGLDNDSIVGGSGSDLLKESTTTILTLSNTTLTGVGTDTLSQIERAELTGSVGNNAISAATFSGSVTLTGNDGADTLIGGLGADSLDGGAGADSIRGGNGNDTLKGGSENDTLKGEAGVDNLFGEDGSDSLDGGSGNDQLSGGKNNDTVQGGSGTDIVIEMVLDAGTGFTLTNTQLVGAASLGTDALNSIEAASLTGDNMNNTISAAAFTGKVTLLGGDGNDSLVGGGGDDSLSGGSGNDTLKGGNGKDSLSGGLGNDALVGGAGNDTLIGDDGNDMIIGDAGRDSLRGGLGDDMLIGGFGIDTIDGDEGSDTALGGQGKTGADRFGNRAADVGDVVTAEIINELFATLFAFE